MIYTVSNEHTPYSSKHRIIPHLTAGPPRTADASRLSGGVTEAYFAAGFRRRDVSTARGAVSGARHSDRHTAQRRPSLGIRSLLQIRVVAAVVGEF